MAQLKRVVAAIGRWQRRVSYYAKQAARTDADVEAERAKRKAAQEQRRAARARRGIKL